MKLEDDKIDFSVKSSVKSKARNTVKVVWLKKRGG